MKKRYYVILTLMVLGVAYMIQDYRCEQNDFYRPTATAIDLLPILSQQQLSDADYTVLFEQTGITAPMVDILKDTPDYVAKMLQFQKDYLNATTVICDKMNWLTKMDVFEDEAGNWVSGFQIAPVKNGYILLSKSTHTMTYRHGHAGIVIDEVRGKTLESLEPGSVSMEQDVSKWAYYPTFKMMRLKDESSVTMEEIAAYAKENLAGLPYNILSMKNQGKTLRSTHCSLLVWQAYMAFGINLDADRGIFISPADIAQSPYLEVLQIYGFDPQKDW